MASLNKVQLIGGMTRDPEIRMTPQGQKVATFSIATSEKWNDKDGNKQESVEFHNVVAWRRLAEIIEQYTKKGSQVYIEGKLTTRSWDDAQTGQKKYKTEIKASSMQMLGGGQNSPSSNSAPPASNSNYNADSVPDMPIDDLPF